jgi:sugar transferase (PEP-CTERM system associated)
VKLLQAFGIAALLLALIYMVFPDAIIGRGVFVANAVLVFLLVMFWRSGYLFILKRGLFNQKILLLGSAELLHDLKLEIEERKDCGYTIAAEFPEKEENRDSKIKPRYEVLCGEKFEGLAEIARHMGVKKIIAAFKERRQAFPTKELLNCRVNGIEVLDGNSFFEMLTGRLLTKQVSPSWLIFSKGFQKSGLRLFSKRLGDVLASLSLLVLCSPILLVASILIKYDSKGPVFFTQYRLGQHRKKYRVIKFRSMVHNAEEKSGPVWATENDDRITRVGRILRKYRIDELPQLWNVLKGEMSFVGPRPEREYFVRELEKRIPYYAVRFTVKPGLTGWAQVSYRYGASEEDTVEKLNYDLFYIKNMSTFFDVLIILRTIKIVLFGTGAR